MCKPLIFPWHSTGIFAGHISILSWNPSKSASNQQLNITQLLGLWCSNRDGCFGDVKQMPTIGTSIPTPFFHHSSEISLHRALHPFPTSDATKIVHPAPTLSLNVSATFPWYLVVHPTNRKWVITPVISGHCPHLYPIYNQGCNPLTIRGMSHQVEKCWACWAWGSSAIDIVRLWFSSAHLESCRSKGRDKAGNQQVAQGARLAIRKLTTASRSGYGTWLSQ